MYRHLHVAGRAHDRACRTSFRGPRALPARALKQAARELLLAQSSDWALHHAHRYRPCPYAERRTNGHILQFTRLYRGSAGGRGERAMAGRPRKRRTISSRMWTIGSTPRKNGGQYMPASLKVLFVAFGVHPFAKTGGLGDVLGALPKALARRGIDVRVVMPLYAGIPWNELERLEGVLDGPGRTRRVARRRAHGQAARRATSCPSISSSTTATSIAPTSTDRRAMGIPTTSSALPSSRAARSSFARRSASSPTSSTPTIGRRALVPVYIDTWSGSKPLHAAASLYTIHNLAHQGVFDAGAAPHHRARSRALPRPRARAFRHDEPHQGGLLSAATLLTTVSPTYAREIQTPAHGFGLDGVLAEEERSLRRAQRHRRRGSGTPRPIPSSPRRSVRVLPPAKPNASAPCRPNAGSRCAATCPICGLVGRLTRQKGSTWSRRSWARLLDLDLRVDPARERRSRRRGLLCARAARRP